MLQKIYEIKLTAEGAPIVLGNGKFLALPPPHEPYTLRFEVTGASDVARGGLLWSNLPPRDTQFVRNKFYGHEINATFNGTCCIDIEVHTPGAYAFYTQYYPMKPFLDPLSTEKVRSPIYYFTVNPRFSFQGRNLPLDALAMQTVVSKWMGPFESWNDKLKIIKNKGYNMVHFTPLQQRGDSNSPYSIYDQLTFDPEIFPGNENDIAKLMDHMETQHELIPLIDVVLNHTANNSAWLQEHPDSGYNINNSPHLSAAYELDTRLLEFSTEMKLLGYPTVLNSTDDLLVIMEGIKRDVLPSIRLWEFYVIDVVTIVTEARNIWKKADGQITPIPIPTGGSFEDKAHFIGEVAGIGFDMCGGRFHRRLDIEKAMGYFASLPGVDSNMGYVRFGEMVQRVIDALNVKFYHEFDDDISVMLEQLFNRIKYTRLDDHGPKMGEITPDSPLIETYFTRVKTTTGEVVGLANNGWIWAANPLVDFASPRSKAYIRREVIVWGDCVKLRYGAKPEDSPYLWDRMTKYVQICAKHFKGFRIDNCHSTPLHVGEYLLDKAREVRPDLYIVAELFSGSEAMDKIFVERLGINSLIREAMQCWTPAELSTLVHKHGGRPIGSISRGTVDGKPVHIRASPIHALFMDCTHDNETPYQRRTLGDTLPNAALVAMCACAIGSVVGFDEGYPHLLNVVSEVREYTFPPGIARAKGILNRMHEEMGTSGAGEMFVHHEGQYITVTRSNAKTGKGWFLIARTKFHLEGDQRLENITHQGTKLKQVLCCTFHATGDFKDSDTHLNGVPGELLDLEDATVEYSDSDVATVHLPAHFPQGSIALFRTEIPSMEKNGNIDRLARTGAAEVVKDLDPIAINDILYKADAEERDVTDGKFGVYNIPNYGSLAYAGLQGWMSVFRLIIRYNELGHPLCDNLRAGTWALDFLLSRIRRLESVHPTLKPLADWFEHRFDLATQLPSFLLPRFFVLIVQTAYSAITDRAIELCTLPYKEPTEFYRSLVLTSFQLHGKIKSAKLTPKSEAGALAAGLPHFSVSYMRCWGRDVFISLRGLLVCTGLHKEAKAHILAFASVLKHGMIPNLLDSGNKPRYNSRDSVWFFLQAIQDYCLLVPDGYSILQEKVKRRFPLDDRWIDVDDPEAYSYESSIEEIIVEVMSRHAAGIHFREAHAGPSIDFQMKDEGFNIDIDVDWETGMIFGGNQWNCGTWMDKMGESERAGNKGWPGTPRDGAAIEITGLLKSTLRWLSDMNAEGKFSTSEVKKSTGEKISFSKWNDTLQKSFEHCYYIPVDPAHDHEYDIETGIVNRRGIYKDLYRSGKLYEDYQLRPNFAIAMAVAPELFDPSKAIKCISIADKHIRGPLGMRTLDPSDLNYRPDYINGIDNDDFAVSKGRNYHQGPEWVWCIGFFFRAMLKFGMKRANSPDEILDIYQQLYLRLRAHRRHINESVWAGLAELTNKDGSFCADSCTTQAWSSSCLIDLYQEISTMEA
ncbi:glycoside hydrolase family 13 protein [Tortispora caseinolytica NRRL Y-17796]|uniref:Glycogen debranching enzyme n=1 Tax=Tortispora caseinolytica NRRL Y-17796 TaxID=767744 RepID=A0A1E4TH04_9ASCO|nr:glycoside hydrolase family 13 protein [Tortispora caseinolytica NRRL Y-17796]